MFSCFFWSSKKKTLLKKKHQQLTHTLWNKDQAIKHKLESGENEKDCALNGTVWGSSLVKKGSKCKRKNKFRWNNLTN